MGTLKRDDKKLVGSRWGTKSTRPYSKTIYSVLRFECAFKKKKNVLFSVHLLKYMLSYE